MEDISAVVLASRPRHLEKTVSDLFRLSDFLPDCPLFVFYFPWQSSEADFGMIQRLSPNVSLLPTSIVLPRFEDSEMFYNRKNDYAKAFGKSRLGYLDMCYWRFNLFAESALRSADNILVFDDDSEFLESPDPFLEQAFSCTDWVIATAETSTRVTDRHRETRQELFATTQKFVSDWQIEVQDPVLSEALAANNEEIFHRGPWSIGNFNLYRAPAFRSSEWCRWAYHINLSGGAHRYRWGDIETLGIFAHLHYKNSLLDLGMVQAGAYKPKMSGASVVRSGYQWSPGEIFGRARSRFAR